MRKLVLKTLTSIALAASLSLIAVSSANAQSNILFDSHVDFDIAFEDGAFELALHDDDTDAEFDPADTLLFVGPEARTTRPAGSEFDFIGVPAGADVWVLPATTTPPLLLMGISAEEVGTGIFVNDTVTLEFVSFVGPGQFSMFRTSPALDVRFTTSNGVNPAEDFVTSLAGAEHVDYAFAFTELGVYEITLRATGNLVAGGTAVSEETTYFFGVETRTFGSAAAPEPGTFALLGLGLAGFALRRKKA
jgi:surface-anchored protein